ncbi:MAG: cell envelope protein SmpA [Proteobacteria bacterium]|nr:MAG: cell envelope protein SmpA [Pseudomonadota bacterium]
MALMHQAATLEWCGQESAATRHINQLQLAWILMKKIILVALITTLFTGCSRYSPTVLQGNALDATTVGLIKVGMSKADVLHILGSPLMQDSFHPNRWDYVYYSIEKGKRSGQQNLTLEFDSNNQVSRIR